MERTAMEPAETKESNEKGLGMDLRWQRCLWNDEQEKLQWTRIWQGTAAVSFLFNLLAIIIEGSIVSILAGILAIGIAPVVFYRQERLQQLDTLRMVQNQLREQVKRLHGENDTLSEKIQSLEEQVDRLSLSEGKLEDLASKQGSTVDSFLALLRDNQTTIVSLKETAKADVTQSILHALIESDFDASGHFSDDELKILELRVQQLPVVVNTPLLLATVSQSDRKLATVLDLVRHIDMDHLPDDERIFRLDTVALKRRLPKHSSNWLECT